MKTKFFNFFVALSIVISACDKDLPHADDNLGIEVKSGTTFFQYKPSSEDEFGNFGKEHKNGKLLVDEDIVIDKTQSGTKVSIGNNAKGWLQVIVWDGNNYDRYTGQVEQGKGQSWHFTGKMVKYYWCICDQGPDDYDGPIPEGDWIEFWNFNWRHFSMTPAVVGAEFCLPTVEDFLKNPKWFYDPEIHIFLGWDVFNVEKQQWQWFQKDGCFIQGKGYTTLKPVFKCKAPEMFVKLTLLNACAGYADPLFVDYQLKAGTRFDLPSISVLTANPHSCLGANEEFTGEWLEFFEGVWRPADVVVGGKVIVDRDMTLMPVTKTNPVCEADFETLAKRIADADAIIKSNEDCFDVSSLLAAVTIAESLFDGCDVAAVSSSIVTLSRLISTQLTPLPFPAARKAELQAQLNALTPPLGQSAYTPDSWAAYTAAKTAAQAALNALVNKCDDMRLFNLALDKLQEEFDNLWRQGCGENHGQLFSSGSVDWGGNIVIAGYEYTMAEGRAIAAAGTNFVTDVFRDVAVYLININLGLVYAGDATMRAHLVWAESWLAGFGKLNVADMPIYDGVKNNDIPAGVRDGASALANWKKCRCQDGGNTCN